MLRTTAAVALPTGTWTVDIAASRATFVAREKFGDIVHGTIPLVQGTVTVTGGEVTAVDAELDMTGIATGNTLRDKDLRGKHFFHTAARPTIRFTAGAARRSGEGDRWTLPGVVHVNGRECPVELTVRLDDTEGDPGAGVARVTAHGVLDKRDAGVRAPNWLIRHPVAVEIAAILQLAR